MMGKPSIGWSYLLLSILLSISSFLVAVSGQACLYFLPAPDNSGCYLFDLSSLQKPAGYAMREQDDERDFLVNICQNVNAPFHCSSPLASVGYEIMGGKCYRLGHLSKSYVLPLNVTDPTAGIRLIYTDGDSGPPPDTTQRSLIFDIICNKNAGLNSPTVIVEEKDFHYFVKWYSSAGCPVVFESGKKCAVPQYDATWESLNYRPRPSWYDDAKFGIFIHWGLFSVPSYGNEWYWYNLMTGDDDIVKFHNRVYGCSGVDPDKFPCEGPQFSYEDFPSLFKAELFNPDAWANLFKNAGAKYVVLTSKHHEGWCNFPSDTHFNWNSWDLGPRRDLVGDLSNSVKKAGLHMGLYHSLREWYNPLYIQDNEDNCNTTSFVDLVLLPTLQDITMRYEPEVIWADGSGDVPCTHDSVTYWKAPKFISWLYNSSPVRDRVVVNDRWGDEGHLSGGDYMVGPDRYTPGKLLPMKWESCFTIQQYSWGYDRTEDISNFWNTSDLIYQLVQTVSCNGNLLLNVGPTADGRILPVFEERLLGMGAWLSINGESIYGSVPWKAQNDTADKRIWYTMAKPIPPETTGPVYAISFDWPDSGKILLTQYNTQPTQVVLLGYVGTLQFSLSSNGLTIFLPTLTINQIPSTFAWVFKIT